MDGFLRGLLLLVLGLGVAGFGVCSLCGGVIGISALTEGRRSSLDAAWLAFGCSALGALVAWLCWLGFRAVRRPASPPQE
jgi:hypothetical protein